MPMSTPPQLDVSNPLASTHESFYRPRGQRGRSSRAKSWRRRTPTTPTTATAACPPATADPFLDSGIQQVASPTSTDSDASVNSPKTRSEDASELKTSISIPLASVGAVMGVKGSIVKRIRSETGALVVLQQHLDMQKNQRRREVYISGTAEQIREAKRKIALCVAGDAIVATSNRGDSKSCSSSMSRTPKHLKHHSSNNDNPSIAITSSTMGGTSLGGNEDLMGNPNTKMSVGPDGTAGFGLRHPMMQRRSKSLLLTPSALRPSSSPAAALARKQSGCKTSWRNRHLPNTAELPPTPGSPQQVTKGRRSALRRVMSGRIPPTWKRRSSSRFNRASSCSVVLPPEISAGACA